MSISAGTGPLAPYNAFGSGRYGAAYPSPWLDVATLSMPDHNKNALQWAEYIFSSNGTYRSAVERMISYFLTDLEISSADARKPLGDDEQDRLRSLFIDTLGAIEAIQALDRDESCYGNGFASLVVPFKRFLKSPFSDMELEFSFMAERPQVFDLKYDAGTNEFQANDPAAEGRRGAWKIHDRQGDIERKLRIKLWSPHEIEIIPDLWSGECAYVWRIPDDYKRDVRQGNLHVLERAPKEVLKAIHLDGWFRFEDDAIFHLKQPTLSGIRNRGWGLSRVLVNFRDIWHVQMIRRFNEAIALDYIVPFRLLTPETRAGASQDTGDPLRIMNMGDMRSQVMRMLRQHRRDPASWHFLPFPVSYQALGGEAGNLAPRELLEQAYDVLLNSVGVPVDLYRGSMQIQSAPVSLRLFEATNHSIVHGNNRFLSWLAMQVSRLLTLPTASVTMRRVTHADDFQKAMTEMQLYMGQQLSGGTAFAGLGRDWRDEQRRIADEARYQAKLQAELQEEMQQSAYGQQIAQGQAGGAPGPGAPAAGGGAAPAPNGPGGPVSTMLSGPNAPTTPEEMLNQAETIATEMLGLPESQKDSELRALKGKNEVLHSLVRAKMDEQRQSAQTAGGAMLLGQQPAAAA